MRIIARSTLTAFSAKHPETASSLSVWVARIHAGQPTTTSDVQAAFPKAKVLNAERIRFEIAGGNYRLIAAFDFDRQIAYLKFLGTHKEYDIIDPFTISQF